MKKQESRKNGLYIPSQKVKIDPLFNKTKKYYTAWFYQLKIGYKAISMFLKKIEVIESAKY